MNLQNMAPNAKRSLALTLAFGAVAIGIYLAGVEPAEGRLRRANGELNDLESRHALMMRNIRSTAEVTNRLAAVNAALAPFREAMIEPFLESYAMRAKALVDRYAQEAGLVDLEYAELPPLALPVPKRLPETLHARLPVRITARGSYQAAVSFLLRIEKELPLVALEALDISAERENDRQRIEFTLEWPVRGASTKTVNGGMKK